MHLQNMSKTDLVYVAYIIRAQVQINPERGISKSLKIVGEEGESAG